MKRILVICFLLLSCFAWAQDIPQKPNPPRLVNDFANVLTADQRDALERKLVMYDDSTSTQIVIVVIKTLNGASLEDYSLKILRDWGVGNKKTNNGVVLLAALDDHKVRIEVGYGLEGSIPDITASQIIKTEIAPSFRIENYYRGLDEAADAIIKASQGQYKAPDNYRNRGKGGGGGFIGIVVIFIIIIVILSRINRGGGGGMMNRGGFLPWLVINSMLNSGRGGGSDWGGGGGGWSGGGGGGGFGGFGGGSGGGGGASGSW